MFVQLTSQDLETKHCLFDFYKDLVTSCNTLNQAKWCTLMSQKYLTGKKKKEEMDAIKQS